MALTLREAARPIAPTAHQRIYRRLVRDFAASRHQVDVALWREFYRVLEGNPQAVGKALATAVGFKNLERAITLADAQRFRLMLPGLTDDFRRGLEKALNNAITRCGLDRDAATWTTYRQLYKGFLPVSIATEIERLLKPGAKGSTALLQALRVDEFRGPVLLSETIWNMSNGTLPVVNHILDRAVASGMSATKLSKVLEAYLGPGNEVPMWGGVKVSKRLFGDLETARAFGLKRGPVRLRDIISGAPAGPRTPKGTVSYNAYRLARTEINRTYRIVHAVRNMQLERLGMNFSKGIKWNRSASKTECLTCDGWASADEYGLGPGVYPPDALPFDHPNGLCFTTDVLISPEEFERQWGALSAMKSDEEIVDGIAAQADLTQAAMTVSAVGGGGV